MTATDPSAFQPLPPLTYAELGNDAQRRLWNNVIDGRRRHIVGRPALSHAADATLPGPHNAWLYSPVVGLAASRLGEAVRLDTDFSVDVRELLILTVAAHHDCEEVWREHVGLLRSDLSAWLAPEHLRQRTPIEGLSRDEDAARLFMLSVLCSRSDIEDSAPGSRNLGEAARVEAVLVGAYYTAVCWTISTFGSAQTI